MLKKITFEQAQKKWPIIDGCSVELWDAMLHDMMDGYNQAIDDCNAAMEARLMEAFEAARIEIPQNEYYFYKRYPTFNDWRNRK